MLGQAFAARTNEVDGNNRLADAEPFVEKQRAYAGRKRCLSSDSDEQDDANARASTCHLIKKSLSSNDNDANKIRSGVRRDRNEALKSDKLAGNRQNDDVIGLNDNNADEMVSFTRPPIRTISSSDENDAEGNKTESDGEEGSGEERMSCIDKQIDAEAGNSKSNAAEKRQKQKVSNRIKRRRKKSLATVQQAEIDTLKETICCIKKAQKRNESKLKMDQSKKESEWKKEKETLLQTLNAEREKNRLLEAQVQTIKNPTGAVEAQHNAATAAALSDEREKTCDCEAKFRLLEEKFSVFEARIAQLEGNNLGNSKNQQPSICSLQEQPLLPDPNKQNDDEIYLIEVETNESNNKGEQMPAKRQPERASNLEAIIKGREERLKKIDCIVSKYKEEIKSLFKQMDIKKIRLFVEYEQNRAKFANEPNDPNNLELFKSLIDKTECLKFLVDKLRFLELTLYEVKKDNGLRRSDRSYTLWAEEQRSRLFEQNAIQLDAHNIDKRQLTQFFFNFYDRIKGSFFPLLSEHQREILEKAGAKISSTGNL